MPNSPWFVDGHLDLSLNHRRYERDISLPLDQLRSAGNCPHPRSGTPTVSLPAMMEGGVGIAFATVLALPRPANHPVPLGECESITPLQAEETARRDVELYRRLEREDLLRILTDAGGLKDHVAAWQTARPDRKPGIIMMMEGAEPILSPDDLPDWWERGLRILAPAWYGVNRYTHGTSTSGGLTSLGRELMKHLSQSRMILDLSHLAEEAFYDALDLFPGPVIASHSNARALVPGDRQLSDDMIRRLVGRDGVIGVVMDGWMLVPGWQRGQSNAGLTLEAVTDHIDHICQLAGDVRHVAIGSDLDGGFGREQCPHDLDSIAELPRLLTVLAARGYDGEALASIAHGNWLSVLTAAWDR